MHPTAQWLGSAKQLDPGNPARQQRSSPVGGENAEPAALPALLVNDAGPGIADNAEMRGSAAVSASIAERHASGSIL